MEVRGETYRVSYDPATGTLTFQGSVRLLGVSDYEPVKELLDTVVAAAPEIVTVDMSTLSFLNSLGHYLLIGFILKMRDNTSSQVLVRGLARAYWQERSFGDLQRLMPDLVVEWVADPDRT